MRYRILSLLVVGFVVAFGTGSLAADSTSSKLPPFISINTFEVGSSGFTTMSFASEAITQMTGQKFRILPAQTDVARITALKAGTVYFSGAGTGGIFASSGREEFAQISLGPQDLYLVWCAAFPGWGMVVRGDSGIKIPSDLRGKRVAFMEGWPGTNVQVFATLAFGGLTMKDVEIVKVSGHAAACDALLSGGIDTFNTVPTSTFAYRIESSSHGIGYITHPFNDEGGWKRAREVFPFWTKFTAMTGAGVSKDKPLQTSTNANPMLVAYANQDPEIVYWMAKHLAEAYPVYSQKSPIMKTNWTLEWNLELMSFTSIPIHPGVIRYLKEIGKWTPELEAKNQERLQNRKALISLWNQATVSAKKEKVRDEDFPAYWEKMRAAAGPRYAW